MEAGGEKPPHLFTLVNPALIKLDDKQRKVFDRIKRSMVAVDVKVVQFQPDVLDSTSKEIVVPLFDKAKANMRDFVLKKASDKGINASAHLTWKGEGIDQLATFSLREKSLTGLIYNNNEVYSVEPIGNGLQALTLLDQRKFKDDHPKEFDEIEKSQIKNGPNPAPAAIAAGVNPIVVRILVAYTPNVEELHADVLSLIDGSINLANLSYANSGVNLQLELAATVRVALQRETNSQKK